KGQALGIGIFSITRKRNGRPSAWHQHFQHHTQAKRKAKRLASAFSALHASETEGQALGIGIFSITRKRNGRPSAWHQHFQHHTQAKRKAKRLASAFSASHASETEGQALGISIFSITRKRNGRPSAWHQHFQHHTQAKRKAKRLASAFSASYASETEGQALGISILSIIRKRNGRPSAWHQHFLHNSRAKRKAKRLA